MNLPRYIMTALATLMFVLLFFEKSLGLNVAIYGVFTSVLLVVFKTSFFQSTVHKVVGLGFLLTSILFYVHGSPFTLAIHILSFVLLIGLHTDGHFRNLLYAVPSFFGNYGKAFGDFFRSFRFRKKTKQSIDVRRWLRVIFVPLFIILLFITLYSMASTYFSEMIGSVGHVIGDALVSIFSYLNITAIGVAIIGFGTAVIHSLRREKNSWSYEDSTGSDQLIRTRGRFSRFRAMDLKVEYRSGVFLFAALCVFLLALLFFEIKHIWFGFEWGGETLKELVHEGTYILIVAIIVSMVLVLYYFRKNLNFFSNNKPLKMLSYVWLSLNALLVISVGVRTFHYIHYFGLAYKRIGVLFFLLACMVGLATLIYKVATGKSLYYVLRVNSLTAYILLVAVCTVSWDTVIAKYNFAHYQQSFIHLPFLSNLSDKTLPYLQFSPEQIEVIEKKQAEVIPFARRGYFKDVDYENKIALRIKKFKKEHKNKHWLESIWAEDKAARMLE